MNSIVSSSFLDSENHEGRRILASNDGSYDHMSHFKDILYTLIFFTVVFFIGKVCGKIGLPALVRMKEKGRRKGEERKKCIWNEILNRIFVIDVLVSNASFFELGREP